MVAGSRHDQDRARRARHHFFRRAAQNQMLDAGPAVGRHHDHVGTLGLGLLDDILVRRAELYRAPHFDQIDAVSEVVGENLSSAFRLSANMSW